MTTEEITLPIHARLVRVDETEYWDLSDWPEVDRIYTHYLYDMNQNTYCCEMTPSYELHFVESYPTFKFEAQDEAQEERLGSIIEDVEEIGRLGDGITYMHCREADALVGETFDVDNTPYDEVPYRDQLLGWVDFANGIQVPYGPK